MDIHLLQDDNNKKIITHQKMIDKAINSHFIKLFSKKHKKTQKDK